VIIEPVTGETNFTPEETHRIIVGEGTAYGVGFFMRDASTDICPNKSLVFDIVSMEITGRDAVITFSMESVPGYRLLTSHDQGQGFFEPMALTPSFSYQVCMGQCVSTAAYSKDLGLQFGGRYHFRACVPLEAARLEPAGASAGGVMTFKAYHTFDEVPQPGGIFSLCIFNEDFLYFMPLMFDRDELDKLIPAGTPAESFRAQWGGDILVPHRLDYRLAGSAPEITPLVSAIGIVNGLLHIQTFGNPVQHSYMLLEAPDGTLYRPVTAATFIERDGGYRLCDESPNAGPRGAPFYTELVFGAEIDPARLAEYRVLWGGSRTRSEAHRTVAVQIAGGE
jgi:hypothetical protein